MTRRRPAPGYAPHPLVVDARVFGLVETTAISGLGSCVARHLPERDSETATVFLHGAAGSWTTWTPLLTEAEIRGIGIPDPVLLDLPGWGEAELTDHRREVTVRAISTLLAEVMTTLGYRRFHLVGHSLGGFIALYLAAEWPDRVISVGTVSGTTFSVIRSIEHPVRNFLEVPAFTMLWRVMQTMAALPGEARPIARALVPTGVMRIIFAPLFRHGWRVPKSLVRATAAELRPKAFSAAAEVARGYDTREWASIGCPVRATKGDSDVFVTDHDLIELERVVPDCTTTIIVDCGHFGPIERPAEILAALGFTGDAGRPGGRTVES